jgi:hypothetical protein
VVFVKLKALKKAFFKLKKMGFLKNITSQIPNIVGSISNTANNYINTASTTMLGLANSQTLANTVGTLVPVVGQAVGGLIKSASGMGGVTDVLGSIAGGAKNNLFTEQPNATNKANMLPIIILVGIGALVVFGKKLFK